MASLMALSQFPGCNMKARSSSLPQFVLSLLYLLLPSLVCQSIPLILQQSCKAEVLLLSHFKQGNWGMKEVKQLVQGCVAGSGRARVWPRPSGCGVCIFGTIYLPLCTSNHSPLPFIFSLLHVLIHPSIQHSTQTLCWAWGTPVRCIKAGWGRRVTSCSQNRNCPWPLPLRLWPVGELVSTWQPWRVQEEEAAEGIWVAPGQLPAGQVLSKALKDSGRPWQPPHSHPRTHFLQLEHWPASWTWHCHLLWGPEQGASPFWTSVFPSVKWGY